MLEHYGGVTDDGDRRDDDQAILEALFRYGVIAPLVEGDEFARGDTTRLIEAVVEQTHHLPGTGPVRVKERTVYDWLRRYRHGGIEALRPKVRKDRGRPRVLDQQVIARAIQLRMESPKRRTSTLLDIMKREGSLDGKPIFHRSTLDRHLATAGASRRHMKVLGERRTIKMEFKKFGDLWVGDYHHGPLVLGPDGKPTTAKIGAFIDHFTRYPVADRYYLAENTASLRDCLLRALLVWGRASKVYVDRGSVYRAEQLAYSLKRIDVTLVHSKEYYSQGRGVIERWWQTISPFEDEVGLRDELPTLHDLNRYWEAYRELRYCQAVHSELGKTPNEAIAEVTPQPLEPDVVRELFLAGADRKVHKKDACVRILGRKFLCDSFLRGQKVRVRYDPNDLSSVLIFHRGKRVQKAFLQQPNIAPEPHAQSETQKARQSVDYLALLREDYDRNLLEHARPLAYANINVEPTFDAECFVETVCKLAGLKKRPNQRKELNSFWEMYGPIPEELVRIGTEHAVRLHGRTRHVRVYLHAIRTLVLAHWRNPTKEGES